MSDNKSLVGKQDRDRINVNEDFELRDWSNHFGITSDHLREAVEAVGPMFKDVEAWLSSHHGGTRKPK